MTFDAGVLTLANDALIHGVTVGTGPGTYAASNTTFGAGAAAATTEGQYNVAVGQYALQSNTTGSNNVAIGSYALKVNVEGADNTAIGAFALGYAIAGSSNTAIGQSTLGGEAFEGMGNTAVGNTAGLLITTGSDNSLFGNSVGLDLTTGSNNIIVGTGNMAGNGIETGSGNTFIGNQVAGADVSDTVSIGAGGTERLRINDAAAWSFGDANYGGAGELFLSQGAAAAAQWSGAGLTYDVAAETLTVGTGTGLDINGDTGTISSATSLTLEAQNGDIVLTVANTTTDKVDVAGPSAADYATGLADTNLVNKYYVDQAIATGAAADSVKAVKGTIDLSANGTTSLETPIPAGATVLRVKIKVTTADASALLSVGKTGSLAAYMTTGENDAQATGLYITEDYITEAGSVQVSATVSGTAATAGASCDVIVEYQVASI